MRNKLTKFLTSECPPKGMRQFAKTWKYAACMLLAFILGIGQMWADETFTFAWTSAGTAGYSYAQVGPTTPSVGTLLTNNTIYFFEQ